MPNMENEIRRRFLSAMNDITRFADMREIVRLIQEFDIEAIVNAIGLNEPGVFDDVLEAIRQAYIESGSATMASMFAGFSSVAMGSLVGRSGSIPTAQIRFDMRNIRAERWLQEHSSNLIVDIKEGARESIRLILTQGYEAGENPRTTARKLLGFADRQTGRRIGGITKLAPNQTKWVINARSELISGDEGKLNRYLKRKLRDKRFDRTIKKAIRTGQPIKNVDSIIARYSDKVFKYRAETIARNEMVQASREASDQAVEQALERGYVRNRQNVIKRWKTSRDEAVRSSHRKMHNKTVKKDEPFVLPNKRRLMFPGDTSINAKGEDVIQCRCRAQYEIDFIAEGKEREQETR